MCCLDDQGLGTLPAYGFNIMLIHFLQQLKVPVLPVLHKLVTTKPVKNPDEYLGKFSLISL